MSNTERAAKEEMLRFIRVHGANAAIVALADALKNLGPEWHGEAGAAGGVECVTGYSPHKADDWREEAAAALSLREYRITYRRDDGTVVGIEHTEQCSGAAVEMVSACGLRAKAREGAASATVEVIS